MNELQIFKSEQFKKYEDAVRTLYEDIEKRVADPVFIHAAEIYYMSTLENDAVVYFILNKDTGLTKIGYAKNIKKRFAQIKSAFAHVGVNPSLDILRTIPVPMAFAAQLEADVRESLCEFRKTGEWFDVTLEDIQETIENLNSSFDFRDYKQFVERELSLETCIMGVLFGDDIGNDYYRADRIASVSKKVMDIASWTREHKCQTKINGVGTPDITIPLYAYV